MIIDPKIQLKAMAFIQLDAATANGLTALGFETTRLELPVDTDQVATAEIILAASATRDFNFKTFGGLLDAEGNAIDFSKIYALGILADVDVQVAAGASANPWAEAPMPGTAASLRSLCYVGELAFGAGSTSVLFTDLGAGSTIKIIAIGKSA